MKKLFFIFLFLTFFYRGNAFPQEKVNNIIVKIHLQDITLHPDIQRRIEESVKSVGEKAILDRSLQEVKTIQSSLEKVMQKIFNQVLTGFYVLEVKLEPGEDTVINITITPQAELIESVKVTIDLPYVHPYWQSLLEEKLATLGARINPILVGIPVQSFDWSQSVVRPIIETIIQVQAFFPGFSVDVDLKYGKETLVVLKLKPQEPIVRKVEIEIYSSTIPNLFLTILKKKLSSPAITLLNLPLEFLKTHQEYFKKEIIRQLKKREFRKYRYTVQPSFEIKETIKVILILESSGYRGRVEGIINLGLKEANNPEFKAYLGKRFSEKDEIFLQLKFFPSPLSLDGQVGIGREIFPNFFLSFLSDLESSKKYAWLLCQVNKKNRLEIYQNLKHSQTEVFWRHQLHHVLQLEFAWEEKEEFWTRIVVRF